MKKKKNKKNITDLNNCVEYWVGMKKPSPKEKPTKKK